MCVTIGNNFEYCISMKHIQEMSDELKKSDSKEANNCAEKMRCSFSIDRLLAPRKKEEETKCSQQTTDLLLCQESE